MYASQSSTLFPPQQSIVQQSQLPLSTQPGAQWSWVTHPDASTWATTKPSAENNQSGVGGTSQNAVFAPQHLVEGWLELSQQAQEES